jgi:hypothetical protein
LSNITVHYVTRIIDEPFQTEDNRLFNKTAIIEKYKGQSKLSTKKLGAPELNEIYKQINNEENLNLSQCYFKDFSLKTYRKLFQISDGAPVKLTSFQADHSFFESEYGTDFSYAEFGGQSSSFAYTTFNLGRVNFNYTKCATNLNFNHSEFNLEELSLKFAEFEEGDIRFSGAIFNCTDVMFTNTNFGEGNVNFRQADFGRSHVSFQYARFDNGDVTFDKCKFRGDFIDFRKVEFGNGKADFKRVDFGDGNINFSESEFKVGKISFRSSLFGNGEKKFENVDFGENDVYFDGTVFKEGLLCFKNSTFKLLSLADCNLGGHCDFRVKKGDFLDLSDAVIKDVIDFHAGNSNMNLKTLKIEGIKNMGKLFISWKKNNAFNLIESQTQSSFESKANQFHILKESFHQNGKFNSEDSAYVAFKRYEMAAERKLGKEAGGLHYIQSEFSYLFKWLVFDKAGLFATAPLRVFLSMIVVLTFFSILYAILPFFADAAIVPSVQHAHELSQIGVAFYHSAITFFTIGYGDYYPSGHITWLSAAEGWAGVFLMSYFTVAFVRKILR